MDMEAGEVLDDVEENEAPEKKKDMFPKAISLLDEPQPKKKKTNSLAKYASLGWGDMVTTRVQPQPERDTRAQPEEEHRRRYEERPAYRDAAPPTPSKPAIANMTPKELHAESCRLMSMQGPKLLQLSNSELQALVMEAVELETAYQKHFERTNTLIDQVNEMARLEEGKLESLLQEVTSYAPSDLPPMGDILVANVRTLLDTRRKAREPAAVQQPMPQLAEEPLPHVSHPYAAPVIAPSFNPLVPPPGVGPPPTAPPSVMLMPPSFNPSAPPPLIPSSSTAGVPPSGAPAPLPADFSIPPPDFSRPPPFLTGGLPPSMSLPPPDFSIPPTMNHSVPPPALPPSMSLPGMDLSKPPPRIPMVRLVFHDEITPSQGEATPPHPHSSTLSAPPPAPSLMGNASVSGGGTQSPAYETLNANIGIQAAVRAISNINSPQSQRTRASGGGGGGGTGTTGDQPQSLMSLRLQPPPGTSPLVGGSPRVERPRHDSHTRQVSPSPQKKTTVVSSPVVKREEERGIPPPKTPPIHEAEELMAELAQSAPPVQPLPEETPLCDESFSITEATPFLEAPPTEISPPVESTTLDGPHLDAPPTEPLSSTEVVVKEEVIMGEGVKQEEPSPIE
ncbi:hypothetical protein PMAYCL1PPCAC_23439 [Pristionchus mayeri]|uniref:Uncharacterized protein n=1 Tax=Pristionchus mayeri TaxID=1317129 RepID=A0AAN5D091_9BILA|nr:hypothetical protein PMAYCL1PPCAC_23439 [Pristionchus mayeri]